MKVNYDAKTDTLTVIFRDVPVAESDGEKPGIVLHYDNAGDIVSIDVLDASRRVEEPRKVTMTLDAVWKKMELLGVGERCREGSALGAQARLGPMLRVVHDTNVAVSALLFRAGSLAWLRDAWAAGTVVPVICRSTIAELERVLLPEVRPQCGRRDAVRVPRCRDEDDRLFLRLAGADALVTGDADLIAVAPKSRVRILTPAALHALVESRPRTLEEARATYRVERTTGPVRVITSTSIAG